MKIKIFNKVYRIDWHGIRSVRRKLSAKELAKLSSGRLPRVDPNDYPFYCIVCKDIKTGSCIASHEYGGWVCAWHKKEEIEAAKPLGLSNFSNYKNT